MTFLKLQLTMEIRKIHRLFSKKNCQINLKNSLDLGIILFKFAKTMNSLLIKAEKKDSLTVLSSETYNKTFVR